MAMTWADHMTGVNSLLDAERSRRAALRAATAQQRAASAGSPAMPAVPDTMGDTYQGGANAGMSDAASGGGGARWGGGLPNAQTLASAFDINPTAARAGLAAIGLLSGPVGLGIGALNGIGNIANTSSNVGMLNGLGVNPGVGSVLGGLFGFNGLAGNPTSALNAAMANQYSGFANLSPAQMPGDFNTSGWGGWGDIAAAMDAANAAAQSGTPSNPSGGIADRGDIQAENLFMKGGYTGAGDDGVVQPHKRAGIVHEGELVIPHHMVKKMMKGLMG